METSNGEDGNSRRVSLRRVNCLEVSAGRKYWDEVYGDIPNDICGWNPCDTQRNTQVEPR